MGDDDKALDALRREIDKIDDQIQDLLIRRSEVVERIGAAKRGAAPVYVRPAREAQVVRRLVERHRGPFPVASVVQIWREIIAALTALQGPYSVAVYHPEGGPDYRSLARRHFGAVTPITTLARERQVVAAVSDGSASVGVLPLPDDDDTEPWWRYLLSDLPDRPRIVARLPAVAVPAGQAGGLGALVIARVAFEDSGDDHSYLVFQARDHISRGRLQTALAENGLIQSLYCSWRDEEYPISWHHLVELEGYVDSATPAVERLVRGFEPPIGKVFAIGGYPAPLAIEDRDDNNGEES
jgi:chorismate mutase/prephenate dehydratase